MENRIYLGNDHFPSAEDLGKVGMATQIMEPLKEIQIWKMF